MAKNTKRGTIDLNQKFDERMLSIGSPSNGGKPLRRGWISVDTSVSGQVPGRVNFLFNPPQVTVSHPLNSMYPSTAYTTALTDAQNGGQAEWVANTLGQAGEVGVSLLFDRTYELWDRSKKSGLAGQYGAYVDVLAFYKLLGIVSQTLVGGGNSALADGGKAVSETVNFGMFPQNPLRGTPICYLYLGPNSIKFRGFVDNMNVTYTHFSRGMIPMRVQIDMSMQMYMADIIGDTSSGGTVTLPSGTWRSGTYGTTHGNQWTDPQTGITWGPNGRVN